MSQLVGNTVEDNQNNEVPKSDFSQIIQNIILVLVRIKDIIKERYLLLVLVILLGIGWAIYSVLNKDYIYRASITFILKEDEVSKLGSQLDPLSSFFISKTVSQSINLDKLIEVAYSQSLLSNMLFNKCIIGGREDYLINHILIIYYNYKTSYFHSYRGLNGLNRQQFRVFSSVSGLIRGSATITQTRSGAFVVRLEMEDEELTKVTLELFYQNISNFYIDKSTEKAQFNYIFLRNRLDSVRNMLYSSEYQVANFEDRAKNLLLETARVPQVRQIRNVEFYKSLYGELISAYEKSKISLNNITPVFQILSRPYYPLAVISRSTFVIVLTAGLVVGFILILIVVFFYIKKFVWSKYKYLFKNTNEHIERQNTEEGN